MDVNGSECFGGRVVKRNGINLRSLIQRPNVEAGELSWVVSIVIAVLIGDPIWCKRVSERAERWSIDYDWCAILGAEIE